MNEMKRVLEESDREILVRMVVDALRRIMLHYGQWFAEVEHQLGMERALQVENDVWSVSFSNQVARLGKTLNFPVENGLPAILNSFSKETLLHLLESLGINWLANDGIWFQAVENRFGMNDAKRCNDTCWTRYSPFEAARIKEILGLPENGGIGALKKALAFRMYALVNEQSIESVEDNVFIFRMENCRVQDARRRRGLDDYPCKSVGLVEYPCFAECIDERIQTECLGCPPDPHPGTWFCAWKFTLIP
jgi:hypothetical protein